MFGLNSPQVAGLSWLERKVAATIFAEVPEGSYSEALGSAAMAGEEIRIVIDLGRGSHSATLWTTDLSHEYIQINAEYRT